MIIKAVNYDLDGTIVDTDYLHVLAWDETSSQFKLGLSGKEIHSISKGISSVDTLVKFLLGKDKTINDINYETKAFIETTAEAKFRYLMQYTENENIQLMPGFSETFDRLRADKLGIAIYTSARKENVEALQRNTNSPISKILTSLEGKIVWKEMYKKGKPDAEPLLLALKLNETLPHESLAVGDAFADYKCSQNAGARDFVFFGSQKARREEGIPYKVPTITNHLRIFDYIEGLKGY